MEVANLQLAALFLQPESPPATLRTMPAAALLAMQATAAAFLTIATMAALISAALALQPAAPDQRLELPHATSIRAPARLIATSPTLTPQTQLLILARVASFRSLAALLATLALLDTLTLATAAYQLAAPDQRLELPHATSIRARVRLIATSPTLTPQTQLLILARAALFRSLAALLATLALAATAIRAALVRFQHPPVRDVNLLAKAAH